MQFDELDIKAREAAERHHPRYDENAWGKMEKLLDRHLPQKNSDRRRFFFLFFTVLLLGGSTWLVITRPWHQNKSYPLTERKTRQQNLSEQGGYKDIARLKQNPEKNINTLTTGSDIIKKENLHSTLTHHTQLKTGSQQQVNINMYSSKIPVNTSTQLNVIRQTNRPDPIISVQPLTEKPLTPDNVQDKTNKTTLNTEPINSLPATIKPADPLTNVNIPVNKEISIKSDPVKTGGLPVVDARGKNPVSVRSRKNAFSLSVSTGPDISATGKDKPGKIKLLAGAGFAYTFKDRISVKTGLYSARKIYTSSPDQYHPPSIFWTYYPNLQQVNADCKVIEIPVSLAYHFGHAAGHNMFVSAGLSSYLMKTEVYDFLYKNSSGQLQTRKWTFKNKNENYFSVLTLSGGYQQNISKTFSFSVEPYLKLPMSGVGYGKVKLNSGGVLLSLGIKPFGRSRK